MNKVKYEKVDLTADEYKDALLNRDSLNSQLKIKEFSKKHFDEDIKLRLPFRMLEENLKRQQAQTELEVNTLRSNLKLYEKQVRTKQREVPIQPSPEKEVEEVVVQKE